MLRRTVCSTPVAPGVSSVAQQRFAFTAVWTLTSSPQSLSSSRFCTATSNTPPAAAAPPPPPAPRSPQSPPASAAAASSSSSNHSASNNGGKRSRTPKPAVDAKPEAKAEKADAPEPKSSSSSSTTSPKTSPSNLGGGKSAQQQSTTTSSPSTSTSTTSSSSQRGAGGGSLRVPPPGLATGSVNSSNNKATPAAPTKRKRSPSISAASSMKIKLLANSAAEGVPAGVMKGQAHNKGRLRSRSPSLTPAAARAAAANLKVIREAAARARARREKHRAGRQPQADYITGEHVKGLSGIYLRFLHSRPILAVFATSVLLWGIGDSVSQAIERRLHAKNIDEAVTLVEGEQEAPRFKWGRFFGALADGSLIAGVGGYYWYSFLDKFVTHTCLLRSGTFAFLATKMVLEFVVWHPLNLITFWMVVGFADGDSLRDILKELRDDFFPTLLGEYALWTPVDLLNFRFVPVHLQVILCNMGALLESVFLSFVRSQGFPGFPAPAADSLEDRGQPISIIDVMRATDVPFSHALRDGAQNWKMLDPEDRGFVTADDMLKFLGDFDSLEEFEEEGPSADRLLPGVPSVRATEACAGILIKHALQKGSITRREYLRFVGELNHAAYRSSLLPEVAFTLFDTSERHMITGSNLIQLAQLLHDTPEGQQTLLLMMPVLEALRNKELTVDEASAVLQGVDTLSRFQKGDVVVPEPVAIFQQQQTQAVLTAGGKPHSGGWWGFGGSSAPTKEPKSQQKSSTSASTSPQSVVKTPESA